MCGRFAFYSPVEATAALFGARDGIEAGPRYNIAPTQELVAVRRSPERVNELALLRWGLVPFWAKDPSIGNRMINARAETVAEKPSFRNAYKQRRCLILADGFYEWQRQGDVKIPWFISLASGEPFGFAGLWENWADKETGESMQTATIVTTEANEFMQALHSRMPVVLEPEAGNRWLAGDPDMLAEVEEIMPSLRAWPVDRRVNNARNEGSELVRPAGETITS